MSSFGRPIFANLASINVRTTCRREITAVLASNERNNQADHFKSSYVLFGLKKGQEKNVPKSDSDSTVFMEDSAEDVARKIQNAYCPSKEEEVEEAM